MPDEVIQRAVRLLEVQPDLGVDLHPAAFEEARRMVVCPVVRLAEGLWEPPSLAEDGDVRGRALACIMVDGLVVRETLLADRACSNLYGPGELFSCQDHAAGSLPALVRWHVPTGATLAVLDDRFLAATRRWPWIAGRVIGCAADQIGRAHSQQAISQLPRIEDRLVALFWHLADRFGRVCPNGITVPLPLTHEALGRLVGARRPTVSLGLQDLADRGVLTRPPGGGWLLSPQSLDTLAGNEESAARVRSALARVRAGMPVGADGERAIEARP